MGKLSIDTKHLIDTYTTSNELIPISCMPKGFHGVGLSIGPCIFVGPKHKMIWLYDKNITIVILEKILNKALKDNNKEAAIALLHYAVYNKKTFWRRYKETPLGVQVMAEILGQHE